MNIFLFIFKACFSIFGACFSKFTIHLTVSSKKYLTDRKRNLLFMKTVNSGSYRFSCLLVGT